MNSQLLQQAASSLFVDHKDLLAKDDSNGTCNKRFAKLGIPQTVEARREYRELIVTTPGLNESISGAILFDEIIRQQKSDGTPLVKVLMGAGITPCIKVGLGAKELAGRPGEKVTEGLDGLRDRLSEYFQKPTLEEAADATVNCFLRTVPAAVPAIAFLSGGQPAELASSRLNAMNVRFKSRLPWALAFSFSRAIQQPALEIWNGNQANVAAVQRALYHRALCNKAARAGEYSSNMEKI